MRHFNVTGISLILILTALSCDPFFNDSIPKDKQIIFNQTEYYILPATSLVLDVKYIVGQSWLNGELSISQNPAHGKLIPFDTLMFKYKPDATFTHGKDQFIISITSNGKTVKSESITISLIESSDEISCDKPGIYVMEDFTNTKPDSSISIKFLANDKFCGIDYSTLKFSIFQQPANGTAILAGDSIIYLPAQGSMRTDSIMYKISSGNADLKINKATYSGYGMIRITVNSCHSILKDYYVLDLTDNIDDPVSSGECAGGYKIIDIFDIIDKPCSVGNNFSFAFEKQTNYSGAVCAGSDFEFAYYKNEQTQPKNDTAVYRICVNGICKNVRFYIIRIIKETQDFRESFISLNNINAWSIFFTDENIGYIGGNSLLKTSDGGQTWREILSLGDTVSFTEIYFSDTNNGFVAYRDKIPDTFKGYHSVLLKTNDGGLTWTQASRFDNDIIASLYFESPEVGLASTNSDPHDNIYKTTNGGATWTLVLETSSSSMGVNPLEIIGFTANRKGLAFSGWGSIFRTDDMGNTWNETGSNLCYIPDPNMCTGPVNSVALGGDLLFATKNWILAKSLDYGNNWFKIRDSGGWGQLYFSRLGSIGFSVTTTSISGCDNACWYPSIQTSKDRGNSWVRKDFDEGNMNDLFPTGAAIPNEHMAYLLFRSNTGNSGILKYWLQ